MNRKRMSFCVLLIVMFAGQFFSVKGSEKRDDWETFDADAKIFYDKGSALRLDGLKNIAHYEHLPAPDGRFDDYVDVLCALPPRKEHYPLIIEMLRKSDPYLQEAGVKLATASVRTLNDYTGLEAPFCDILNRADLDPWVLRAIVQFASVSCNRISPPLVKFYADFAAVAYERTPTCSPGKTIILRQMGIDPYLDARRCVLQVMLNSTNPTPRSDAILPYLERAFNTKGWSDTYKAAGQHNN